MLQPEIARQIHDSGGIRAIAISHPHFFGGIATWAEEFDAPVYIHEKDKQFVTEPNSHIQPWSGVCALSRDSSDMPESYTLCGTLSRSYPCSGKQATCGCVLRYFLRRMLDAFEITMAAALDADIIEGTEGRWDTTAGRTRALLARYEQLGHSRQLLSQAGIAGCQAWHGSIVLENSTG